MEAFETGSNCGSQNSTRDVAESRKHPARTHANTPPGLAQSVTIWIERKRAFCLCLVRDCFERLGWELGGVGVGVG